MTAVSVAERRKSRPTKKIILRTVVKGNLTIHNVPFVQCDSELNDFRMTGKAIFKLADLVQYMKDNQYVKYNYEDFKGS